MQSPFEKAHFTFLWDFYIHLCTRRGRHINISHEYLFSYVVNFMAVWQRCYQPRVAACYILTSGPFLCRQCFYKERRSGDTNSERSRDWSTWLAILISKLAYVTHHNKVVWICAQHWLDWCHSPSYTRSKNLPMTPPVDLARFKWQKFFSR